MIIVTGAAGFIGSCMVGKLNEHGFTDILLVDEFDLSKKEKYLNLQNKNIFAKIDRQIFPYFLEKNAKNIEFIFHIGARTDTTECDEKIFNELNLNYSKVIWNFCVKYDISLVYASTAASYGDGELGYDDQDYSLIYKLKPMNLYGESKNDFDKWVLEQNAVPPNWYGLKFFNVFGPNEYHKGRMASVVFHSYNQIVENNKIELFKSHNPKYKDGEQLRDFIYIKDVIDVMFFLMSKKPISGIYNLGTGKARSFLDVANLIFKSINKTPKIEFIDTPIDIRDKYQYFTEAKMDKLRSIGYDKSFYTLEEGVKDYVENFLIKKINF